MSVASFSVVAFRSEVGCRLVVLPWSALSGWGFFCGHRLGQSHSRRQTLSLDLGWKSANSFPTQSRRLFKAHKKSRTIRVAIARENFCCFLVRELALNSFYRLNAGFLCTYQRFRQVLQSIGFFFGRSHQ